MCNVHNSERQEEDIDIVVDNMLTTHAHMVKYVSVKLKNINYSKYLLVSEFDDI